MAAFLRVTHKMVAWKSCLQDGGVYESFTHKMAAWEICPDGGVSEFCLQDGGVSEGFTHKMAAQEIFLQDGGVLRVQNMYYVYNLEYIQ